MQKNQYLGRAHLSALILKFKAHFKNKLTNTKIVIFSALAILFIGVAACEYAGWPFLAAPLERKLSSLLQRNVSVNHGLIDQNTGPKAVSSNTFEVRFLGGLRLKATKLNIAAPSWSKNPYFLDASDIALKLRYIDLWHAYKGEPLRIKSLQASALDSFIERKANGQASWQFSDKPSDPNKPIILPSFDELQLKNGLVHIVDVPLDTNIEAKLSLVDEITTTNTNTRKTVLTASATGKYKAFPVNIELVSTGELPTGLGKSDQLPAAITLSAGLGSADLKFKGTTADMMHPKNFAGSYDLRGPSLATVGDFIGVTLPTTAAFNTNGTIEKQDSVWSSTLKKMAIGGSVLKGHFTFDQALKTPLLKGELSGKLVITDLGPAFGATGEPKKTSKVLPTRPFDLASLHKMNADVLFDMQYLDLKTTYLEPLKPLKAHLTLNNAVLTLSDIKALTAGGQLTGNAGLDGRGKTALLDANLAWKDVRLERWVKQDRAGNLPPYISGKLNGQAKLKGRGISSAELLASLDGNIRSQLLGGAVSHLGVEVAGLDIAQSIGVLFKGDDALPVQCAVVDLQAKNGVLSPTVAVVDTADTTLWVEGSLSLATEKLNLKAMALPKDFSPLTLRSPLNITGDFASPQVSLEKKPIALKAIAAGLLAFINPLAAIIPLLDSGDTKDAKEHAAGCMQAMQQRTKK